MIDETAPSPAARMGYVQCDRCLTHLPPSDVEPNKMFDPSLGIETIAAGWHCHDFVWCRQRRRELDSPEGP